jgi:hypothetical protein
MPFITQTAVLYRSFNRFADAKPRSCRRPTRSRPEQGQPTRRTASPPPHRVHRRRELPPRQLLAGSRVACLGGDEPVSHLRRIVRDALRSELPRRAMQCFDESKQVSGIHNRSTLLLSQAVRSDISTSRAQVEVNLHSDTPGRLVLIVSNNAAARAPAGTPSSRTRQRTVR